MVRRNTGQTSSPAMASIAAAAASAVAVAFGAFVSPASAGLVAPGGLITAYGTTAAAVPELSGTIVRDVSIPLAVDDPAGHVLFRGTLQDRVVREATTDTLDFYQQITADPTMPRAVMIDFTRQSGFASGADLFSTDVDFRVDGSGTIAPSIVRRQPDGSIVQLSFNGKIKPSEQTRYTFVKTDAQAFDLTGLTEVSIIGKRGVQVSAFVSTARPTPGSDGSVDPGQGAGGGDGGDGGGGGAVPPPIDVGGGTTPPAVPLPTAAALFPAAAGVAVAVRRRWARSRG